MIDDFDADNLSRTALLGLHRGTGAHDSLTAFRSSGMRIVAGVDVCRTRQGQAALVTAVMTSCRAFGDVTVVIDEPEAELLGGPHRGHTLLAALNREGATVRTAIDPTDSITTLAIGPPPTSRAAADNWLIASWTGWTATVKPLSLIGENDLAGDDGNSLSALTAGALGVAEAFLRTLAEPASDAGLRATSIDLWNPCGGATTPPSRLAYAPAQWWLLGLGHLGQGFAHALSWLDYRDATEVQVVLQDIQRTVPANHSTGLLTPKGSKGERKTRLVAGELDRCGFDTVVIERPLDGKSPVRGSDVHVALVGVDNLATRLFLDTAGWSTAIDVGLGAGAGDFDGITVVRFPGRPDTVIRSWQEARSDGLVPRNGLVKVPGQDPCGIARLNGVAVGASFVGAIAGTLGIAESLRCLHGGVAHSVMNANLRDGEIRGGSVDAAHPVALELR
ncbi:hypothetical protein ACVGOW_20440 [Pseudonocardia saturnea]